MTFLQPADWTFPVPIRYGPGRMTEIAEVCRASGMSRPLIVTDQGSRDLDFMGRIGAVLKADGIEPAVFAGFSPNPTDDQALDGSAAFDRGGHDGVIGIGGGSGMDGAKAVALLAGRDTPLWSFDFDREPPDVDHFVPLVTVPTTAGTGAETESTAMITDTERGIKGCVWHPGLKPACALLDPELTLGLPRNLTAWTGADALTHALEAYAVEAYHPLCDGAALEALKLIGRWLPIAVNEPGNLEARGAMLTGSCLAGVAFLKGLGMVHAISHMVGAVYDTQHGLTNAVLLPAVLRFNEEAMGEKAETMRAALGLPGTSFTGLYEGVASLMDALDIPRGLGALGVGDDRLTELAEKASRDAAALTNPRRADTEEIESLLRETLDRAR